MQGKKKQIGVKTLQAEIRKKAIVKLSIPMVIAMSVADDLPAWLILIGFPDLEPDLLQQWVSWFPFFFISMALSNGSGYREGASAISPHDRGQE